jgi:hypothetical protein
MARKKKNQGGGGGAIILLATAFTLIILIGTFVLIFFWLYYNHKAKELIKPRSIKDFDLSQDEINDLSHADDSLQSLEVKYQETQTSGNALNKRQDGRFNERSQKGKELNQIMISLEPRISEAREIADEIRCRPEKRLANWLSVKTYQAGFKKAIYFYVGSFIAFLVYTPQWMLEFGESLQQNTLIEIFGDSTAMYGASFGALLTAGIVLLFVKNTEKNRLLTELNIN